MVPECRVAHGLAGNDGRHSPEKKFAQRQFRAIKTGGASVVLMRHTLPVGISDSAIDTMVQPGERP